MLDTYMVLSEPLPGSRLIIGRFCINDENMFDLKEVTPIRDIRILKSRPAVCGSISSNSL